MPDFIALRGDPSDKIPGARGGARRAPPTSWPARDAGGAARGGALRRRGRCAAALPPHRHARPRPRRCLRSWTGSPTGRAAALAGAGVSSASPAAWRPRHRAPRRPALPRSTRRAATRMEGSGSRSSVPPDMERRATHKQLERVHALRTSTASRRSLAHAARRGHDCTRDRAGRRRRSRRARPRGGRPRRLLARTAAGHHTLADRAMGFCLLNNAAVAAATPRPSSASRGRDRRHRRAPRQRHRGDLPRRASILYASLHQWAVLPRGGAGGPRLERRDDDHVPGPAGCGTTSTWPTSTKTSSPWCWRSSRTS